MRSRWKSITFLGVLAVTAALLVAPIASAHYATVTASLDCNGTVSYTLSSWDAGNLDGQNSSVELTYMIGNQTFTTTPGAFTSTVFSFSGSFTVPTSVTSLTLTPETMANWGDGAPGGTAQNPMTYTPVTITRPTDCVKSPSIATSLSPSTVTLGGTTHDSATLSGAAPNAGGTVTYNIWFTPGATSAPDCSGSPLTSAVVNVSGGSVPDSPPYTATAVGYYSFNAVYSGDANDQAATSACGTETLTVKSAPSITTTLSASTASLGQPVHDTATLSGATPNAGGSVTYNVYSGSSCSGSTVFTSTVTVAGGSVPASGAFTPSSAGTYSWQAVYSGDGVNNGATSACGTETLTVNKTTGLSISTSLSASSITLGASVHDSATLTGASSNAGGTVTYNVYAGSSCSGATVYTDTETVTGGNVPNSGSFTPANAGTYAWQAVYSGDANNAGATSACGTETLTVTTPSSPPPPTTTTTPTPPAPPTGTPMIKITKNPPSQTIGTGATANFTIVVTNNGAVTLTNVFVTDALTPNCDETKADIAGLASMVPGASVKYNCSLPHVKTAFTNVAVATGTPPTGPNVTAKASAKVKVTKPLTPPTPKTKKAAKPVKHPKPGKPAIAIVKSPKTQTIGTGATAAFMITVTNTGKVTLTDVTVTDPRSPGCDRNLGTLAAAAAKNYMCTRPDVKKNFTNVATATGKPPTGKDVKASDHANVKVAPFTPPQRPQIAIVKTPKLQTLTTRITKTKNAHGAIATAVTYGTADFTIKVTNTGNTILEAVKVTDALSPDCNRGLGDLAPGASRTYACMTASVKRNFTNVAIADGTSPKGTKVTALDHAVVKVTVKTTSTAGAKFTG